MRRPQFALVVATIVGIAVLYFFVKHDVYTDTAPAGESSSIESARFEISYHRGALSVQGHVVSHEHEQHLLRVTDKSFAEAKTKMQFESLADAPEFWRATTQALLELLSATRSVTATLTPGKLVIRGVATDNWPERFEYFRTVTPGSIVIDIDVIVPKPNLDVTDLCAHAIASHQTGPVYFEESATTFRSSAYAALERTLSLASACRDSAIAITGHTDSSGHEPSNRELSLSRAEIVADYFAAHGISRRRLLVSGVGSSIPAAPNDTRFGRSMNRRITIEIRDAN